MISLYQAEAAFILNKFENFENQQRSHTQIWSKRQYAPMYIHDEKLSRLKREVEDSVKISTLFYGDNMDPWKNIILLNKQNNEFNPIITINKKLFSYNDKVITNLLNNSFSDIEYVNSSYLNKEFSLTDNLESIVDEIIDTSSRINKVDSSEQVESNFKASDLHVEIESIATNPTVSIPPKKNLFTKTDFKNMKKNEIIDIVKDLKISYSSSDTKVVLIDKLISFQDSSKNKNSIQSSSS